MYRIYANKTVEKNIIHYRRIGFTAIPGNIFLPLDWMYCCNIWKLPHAVFGEKSFVTVVIPGNGHRTAMPRTAFRAFVTVVWLHYSRNWASTAAMPCAAFQAFVCHATRWHSAFVTVVTTLFQEMGTHLHATCYMLNFERTRL